MNKITFRFSFDKKHHADVISILESVPKSMRTAFVVEVTRFVSSRLLEIPFPNTNSDNQNSIKQEKEKLNNSEDERQDSKNKKLPIDLPKILGGI